MRFLFQAGPLILSPFGRPRGSFLDQDPGSQLALGVGKVPNLSTAWEQNFPGTAPLLWRRTSDSSLQFGGSGGGECCYRVCIHTLHGFRKELCLEAGGIRQGRALESGSCLLQLVAQAAPAPALLSVRASRHSRVHLRSPLRSCCPCVASARRGCLFPSRSVAFFSPRCLSSM